MSIEEYDKEMAKQYSYLDKIDIEKYMNECTTHLVSDLMDAIENDYNDTEFTNNDFLQGYIFCHMNECEFIEYLEKRYGKRFNWREHSYYTFSLD